MRMLIIAALVIFPSAGSLLLPDSAHAQMNNIAVANVAIERRAFGSGLPGEAGYEPAQPVFNDIYHAPQYLPGYPTSSSIWARVIDVPCRSVGGEIQCEGYNWIPEMGRAEYLYFRPVVMVNTAVSPAGAGPLFEPPAPIENKAPAVKAYRN